MKESREGLFQAVSRGRVRAADLADLDSDDRAEFLRVATLATADSAAVRREVARVLPLFAESRETDGVLREILIQLCRDPDAEVRDWAFAGLGTQRRDLDGQDIREALLLGTGDPYPDARAEATIGLAFRRDLRAVPRIRAELASDDVSLLYVRAAGALGDHSLHAGVVDWLGAWARDDQNLQVEAAARLTDPRGIGDDLFTAVARLARSVAVDQEDPRDRRWARLLDILLEIAPWSASPIRAGATKLLGDALRAGRALDDLLDL